MFTYTIKWTAKNGEKHAFTAYAETLKKAKSDAKKGAKEKGWKKPKKEKK